jgi:5-methylcytosine-specific restriction protein A
MPYKPKKPCAHRGCRELTSGRYCEAHGKQAAKDYNQHKRDPESNKRYGRNWKQIRAAFLASNPLCVLCREDGRLTPADTVHHKRRLSDGGTHDRENLQALCSKCHSRLHAEEGDYF